MTGQGIELIKVSKYYQTAGVEKAALQDLSITIRPGEYVGLMGVNGSGKSTLARLCNGLIQPSHGKIFVNGMDSACPENILTIRQLVGMVFQNPDNQLLCPIVEEEIAFGLENLGLPLAEIRRRVDWALSAVGLSDRKYHAPHLLSGGQKQKTALAAVVAMLPEYLILDEPVTMLDPASRRDLLQQLKALNREKGISILLSSHSPEDFIDADRIMVIHQGSLIMQGTPAEVFAQDAVLRSVGLEPPEIYQLNRALQEAGCISGKEIKSIAELVESICQK